MWSSFPQSTKESTVDVYCCVDWDIFYVAAARYYGYLSISVALTEAENTFLQWSYSTIHNQYCASGTFCYNLWLSDYSKYLVGSHTYSELTPNTLYTVAVLACYPSYYLYSCTVGSERYIQYSNITTRPEGMSSMWHSDSHYNMYPYMYAHNILIQSSIVYYMHHNYLVFSHSAPRFSVNGSTPTSITVHFQSGYYTGPPPHGHEIIVQNKDINSVLSYSRYFKISILVAVLTGLTPNTEYVLHIRANGTHHAGNYGRWKTSEMKTPPTGK